jgi:F0F1-type ATP synthase assembly protein I
MQPDPSSERDLGRGYALLAVGLKFAGGIILFAGGGFLLDRLIGWTPVLTIAGTLVGSGLSFYNMYTQIRAQTEAEKKRRGQGTPQ